MMESDTAAESAADMLMECDDEMLFPSTPEEHKIKEEKLIKGKTSIGCTVSSVAEILIRIFFSL